MSSIIEAQTVKPMAARMDWSLWLRQISAILRIEIKKSFWGRRAILIYLLAAVPVAFFAAMAFFPETAADIRRGTESDIIFANIFEGLVLRTIVFFGCAWIFMNLFRGEIVDKSLHYYFLAPVRREVLVAGKYVSGLVAAIFLFGLSAAGSILFFYSARGYLDSAQALLNANKLGHALVYLSITLLGCLGYGAVFLFIGLFFRNPIIPGLLVYGWEWLNFLLPPVLKKISIVHYLHTLAPVPVPEGPLATVAETTPAWIAVPSLLLFTAAVLVLAAVRIRRTEVRYGND
jgi:ABC-type transport system involved in multi-copper enzyme maturation permease subunit